MVINKIKLTPEELSLLDAVTTDFSNKKNSNSKCPRCGNDFEFHKNGNSYQVKCKSENCLKLTCRGI